MNQISVKIKKLSDIAVVPKYANDGDAGCDLVSINSYTLKAGGGREVVKTGISIELPKGYVALVAPRSGLAAKHGITCVNSPGIIDSGYRGEICVILSNTDPNEDFEILPGDRIAQLMIQKYEHVIWEEVEDFLEETARGEGGFGSSGKN